MFGAHFNAKDAMGSKDAKGSDLEKLSYTIIGTALRVHSRIGPGCRESIYKNVLRGSLVVQGLNVECEKPVSFEFEGHIYRAKLRADLIVEDSIIIEVESQKALTQIDHQQLLTYERLFNLPLGLLFNFGELHLRDGIKRIANNYNPSRPLKP